MLWDCFTFMNELELLDLRLRVLSPVVDKFVLVESTKTFTGKAKPLVYLENQGQFRQYRDRIVHVIVEDAPNPDSPTNCWNVERHQRNAILRGLGGTSPDDRIMISDVDEIPNLNSYDSYKYYPGLVGFKHRLYYYYVNCRQTSIWCGTIIAPRASMPSPQTMRTFTSGRQFSGPVLVVADLGWHFSFIGGEARIREKLDAYSETQTNTANINSEDNIRECLRSGKDLFGRTDILSHKQFVELDDTYPPAIHNWIKEYPYTYKCRTSTW